MGARITIYPAFWKPGENFDLDLPEVFAFEGKYTTGMLSGSNELGKVLYALLSKEEQSYLQPRAHVFETGLEPLDPQKLSQILLKFYYAAHDYLLVKKAANQVEIPQMSPITLFDKLQRDIAGAIFICHMAIEKDLKVYWALG